MEKEPIDEFVDNISAGFDLVPAIKVIVDCKSLVALTSLRNVLNKRIREVRKVKGE